MQMHEMILISVDDHIVEPPNLFDNHVSARYRHLAPRVHTFANGEERWLFDGKLLPNFAPSAVAGRKREELGAEATKYSQMRKGVYDVHARVEDMNANGTLSSLCFATFPGFSGELFLKGQDKDLMLALIQAYNDWHCDEWCGAYPGRFIPLAFVPLWDPGLAVGEIRRMARKGVRAIALPENPSAFGLPSIHRSYWHPIFKACLDEDLALAIHIGTGAPLPFPSPDSPLDWANTMVNITVAGSLVDLLFSPMLRRFPDLRIAMSEGCIGWVPFLMERADAAYELHRFWTKQDFGKQKPSDFMRRNFLYCFHHDEIGLKHRHDVGIDRIAWECDFPHADTTWPRSPEILWESFQHMPDSDIERISHKNAMDFFSFDPFKWLDRNDATVGALRAKATHVDVEPRSMGGGRQPALDPELKVLTVRDMQRLQQEMNEGLEAVS